MSAEQQPEAPIRRYFAVVRRRIWLLVAIVVIVPTVAVGYSLSQPALYRAASTVLISRQSVANQLSGAADVGLQQQSFQQVLVTQSKLARTPDVIRATLAKAGPAGAGLSVDEFRDTSAVEANADSDLLTFTVDRPDAADAKRLVTSYADAYVAYRRTLDSAALNRALADVNAALKDASRGQGRSDAQLVDRLSSSRQQLETRLALQTANAQVVAGPEDAPKVQPRPLRSAFLGLLVGLLVGGVTIFLRDSLDTRVRTSADAETLLGLPVVARVPRPRTQAAVGLALVEDSRSGSAEAFRLLRNNLNFGLLSSGARVVMVTSSTQGEGKSTTIANLAVAYALAGKRVALVDLDLRRPSLARLFDLPGGAGVTGVALGQSSLADALQSASLSDATGYGGSGQMHLDVLSSGPLPPDPGEFIGTEAVRSIFTQLREHYDLVLVDAPPLVSVSDTAVIAGLVDATFVCVRLGLAQGPMLNELRGSLERLGIPVLGQVITGAQNDALAGYDAYYTYEDVDAKSAGSEGAARTLHVDA